MLMSNVNFRSQLFTVTMPVLCLMMIGISCAEKDSAVQPIDEPAPIVPVIISDSVTNRFGHRAVLTARVDLKGTGAEYWIEYGKDSIAGNSTKRITLAKDTGLVDIIDTLAPLSYNTLYYYRLKVANSKGVTAGPLRTFFSPAVDMSVIDLYRSKDVTAHEANLQVFFKSRSQNGFIVIEVGETPAYATKSFTLPFAPGLNFVMSVNPSGLKHSTTYHWRCTVVTDSGTLITDDATFTTTIINVPVEFSYPLDSGKVFNYEYSLQVSSIGGLNPPGLQRKGERIVQVKSHRMENDTLFWELECAAYDTVLTRVGENLPPDTSYDRRVIAFTIKRSANYYHVGFEKILEYGNGYKSAPIRPLPRIVESGTTTVTIGDATYLNGAGLHFYQSGFIGSGGGYIERLYLKP